MAREKKGRDMHGLTWVRQECNRLLGWALALVGAGLLVIGAVGVIGSRYVADDLAFLMTASIAGLGCIGFGTGLLLSAGLHDERRKLDRLADVLVNDI